MFARHKAFRHWSLWSELLFMPKVNSIRDDDTLKEKNGKSFL